MINENTGIHTRSTVSIDVPFINQATAPTIDELAEFFLTEGVRLATGAARKAIAEWGGDVSAITHVVAVTCTNSANPGYDYYLARALGLRRTVDRTLLHGVGCAGGLAALRTAANIALGAAFLDRPARVLVVACELSSLMARSELDSLVANEELRIGVTIFSDGASALVLSNGVGDVCEGKPLYDLLAWDHVTIPDTEKDIGFGVHPNGRILSLPQHFTRADTLLTSRLESHPDTPRASSRLHLGTPALQISHRARARRRVQGRSGLRLGAAPGRREGAHKLPEDTRGECRAPPRELRRVQEPREQLERDGVQRAKPPARDGSRPRACRRVCIWAWGGG